MTRPVSRAEALRRIEDVKALLEKPTPRPLDGQQAFDLTPPGTRITVPTLPGLEEAGMQRAAEGLEEQR
ncbi:hypothetical protein [Streptomyces collinus]|uniref:hypothetical protein n=1 Tax=Streptomyces collinus TaxID=42684 RepID=UPI00381E602C